MNYLSDSVAMSPAESEADLGGEAVYSPSRVPLWVLWIAKGFSVLLGRGFFLEKDIL